MFIEDVETILPIGKHTLRVIKWHFEENVAKVWFSASFMCLCQIFVIHVISNILCCRTLCCCLLSRMHLKVTDQNWITGPNESLLHFKIGCCSFLTSNWENSIVRLHYSFIIFTQITQTFVRSPYIDDIETKIPIGKHTVRVFAWYIEKIGRKGLFRCFIYVFVSICCISCHFSQFVLFNATL